VLNIGAPADERFERIAFPSRTVGYAASRRAVYKTADGGRTWHAVHPAELGQRPLLAFANPQSGWYGALRLSQTDDGGEHWTSVAFPGGPLASPGGLVADGRGWSLCGGQTLGGELALVGRDGAGPWQLLDGDATGYWGGADQPFRRWYVGGLSSPAPGLVWLSLYRGEQAGGAVLRSRDGGKSWTTTFRSDRDLTRIHFRNDREGWLSAGGDLWASRAGGDHWEPQALPETGAVIGLAFDPHGAPFGLVTLAGGKLLLTADGQTWRRVGPDLGPSLPGVAVVDPGCAFVLAADGRVARYLDPAAGVSQGP
jgi:photosystem II stability/assembly factor-like uncharacterized protein